MCYTYIVKRENKQNKKIKKFKKLLDKTIKICYHIIVKRIWYISSMVEYLVVSQEMRVQFSHIPPHGGERVGRYPTPKWQAVKGKHHRKLPKLFKKGIDKLERVC